MFILQQYQQHGKLSQKIWDTPPDNRKSYSKFPAGSCRKKQRLKCTQDIWGQITRNYKLVKFYTAYSNGRLLIFCAGYTWIRFLARFFQTGYIARTSPNKECLRFSACAIRASYICTTRPYSGKAAKGTKVQRDGERRRESTRDSGSGSGSGVVVGYLRCSVRGFCDRRSHPRGTAAVIVLRFSRAEQEQVPLHRCVKLPRYHNTYLMHGARIPAGRARNPAIEANAGWPIQRVGVGRQVIIGPAWLGIAAELSS